MEIVYFTLVGAGLYFLTHWALDRIERARGARFKHRDLIFFAVILVLALVTFQLLGRLSSSG